nr:hypothetical protein [Rhizobium changzhiense]
MIAAISRKPLSIAPAVQSAPVRQADRASIPTRSLGKCVNDAFIQNIEVFAHLADANVSGRPRIEIDAFFHFRAQFWIRCCQAADCLRLVKAISSLSSSQLHYHPMHSLLDYTVKVAISDRSTAAIRLLGSSSSSTSSTRMGQGFISGDNGSRQPDEAVAVQGRFDDGFVHASYLVRQDGRTEALRPPKGPPHRRFADFDHRP